MTGIRESVSDTLKKALNKNPNWTWDKVIAYVFRVHSIPNGNIPYNFTNSRPENSRTGKRKHGRERH